MCYGSNCNYEIMLGENAGECRRPPGKPCPDMIEDEELDLGALADEATLITEACNV